MANAWTTVIRRGHASILEERNRTLNRESIAIRAQTTVIGIGRIVTDAVGLAPASDTEGKRMQKMIRHEMSAGDLQDDESRSETDQQEQGSQRRTKGRS
jgi:hypothetical protein